MLLAKESIAALIITVILMAVEYTFTTTSSFISYFILYNVLLISIGQERK